MADPDPSRPAPAQRLRDARRGWGWSQNDLAAEVEKVRTARNHRPSDRESLRRQIVEIEKSGKAGPMWRSLLADALQADEDHLFGLHVDVALPRPLLLKCPSTPTSSTCSCRNGQPIFRPNTFSARARPRPR